MELEFLVSAPRTEDKAGIGVYLQGSQSDGHFSHVRPTVPPQAPS